MSSTDRRLPVAETFASLQGEGPTAGIPAVFLRLSACNLRCPAWGPPGSPTGCDTTDVWSKVWRLMTPKEILAYWEEQGWFDQLSRGAHLILTGGEPMLYQLPLVPLLQLLKERLFLPYIEVETNATILPVQPFDAYISQYNCSPKLTSAGNPPEKAYVPHVLRYFADDPGGIRANFKFVIQDPDRDVEEIITRYLEPFSIPRRRVWLMPEGATRARQIEMSERVAEVALKHGFNFSPRLQLLIWDRATGR